MGISTAFDDHSDHIRDQKPLAEWGGCMTNSYRWVQWNAHKRRYDMVIAGGVLGYLVIFMVISTALKSPEQYDPAVSMIRATGTCAIIMLHVILCIGPLARLNHRFLVLLYNRRHLGVSMFAVASLHAFVVFGYYGGFGVENPFIAVLAPAGRVGPPYELYGFLAFVILLVMAVTSHDFWLANLGAVFWKWMHMMVYVAYTLLIAHVVFGVMQSESHPIYVAFLTVGVSSVTGLHLFAGFRSSRKNEAAVAEWFDVCELDSIPDGRAAVVAIEGMDSVAVFRDGDTVSAISNVCAHQGGPLGEGQIIDGCVTCPWHGYQYKPECGQSPPPYTEKIATYELRVSGTRVQLNPEANEPGTHVEPLDVSRGDAS